MEPLTPRALERRLKRYVLKETHDFLAVGAPGFETVLWREVQSLPDVTDVNTLRGGVEFRGPLSSLYHANLQLATAHRVLWRVADFLAQSYPMLYNKAEKIPWERYLGFAKTLRFSVSCRSSKLQHQDKIAETLLSAVQSALEPLGLRPRLAEASETADIELHVRLFRDRCTLSLDSSGEHLHKRGYRTHIGDAPLRETLAAALFKTVLLNRDDAPSDMILDPMCGSGTLLLEAARLLRGTPPGDARPFAFEQLPIFQPTVWERLKREAQAGVKPSATVLLGFDEDARVLEAAKHNAASARVAEAIDFDTADARSLDYAALKGQHRNALLICNPPYGKRLNASQTRNLYAELSTALCAAPGWTFAILTPDPAWLSLPASERLEFSNGGLKVFLVSGAT